MSTTTRRQAPTGALAVVAELVTGYATGRLDPVAILRVLTARPGGPWATVIVSTAKAIALHDALRAAKADHDRILDGFDDPCARCTPAELCPLHRQRLYAWHSSRDAHATAILTLPTGPLP